MKKKPPKMGFSFWGFWAFHGNPVAEPDMNRSLVRLAAGPGRGEAELGHHPQQIQGRRGATPQTSAEVSSEVLDLCEHVALFKHE